MRHYCWSIDTTQAPDSYQVTVMIYSGEAVDSEYMGEFTMFYESIDDIEKFLLEGLDELQSFKEIMLVVQSSTSKTIEVEEK